MKSLSIKVTTKKEETIQPIPIMPPDGKIIRSGNDFEVADPRYHETEPYLPRVNGTKYTVPQAHKYNGGNPQKMTYGWAKLWHDSLAMYAPKAWSVIPPIFDDGVDWTWLGNFIPETELDKWWLHLIHYTRAYTNHMSVPMDEYYDPITGFGAGTQPFMKEAVMCANNYLWKTSSGNNYFWALDGTKEPPLAEQLRDMFFLLSISTQSSPVQIDKTKSEGLPNGVWKIPGFPQASDNIVVHPLISTWENGKQMDWNGIHLREAVLPTERLVSWPPPARVTWPFIPYTDMVLYP